jgi:hypothetical protein
MPPARATRASATAANHSRRHLASPEPLDSFPMELWSFPKLELRYCLTGAAGSPSPDFGHPPPRVDRATRWTIFQFLKPTTSLASREAPQLTRLSYPAVVRPGSSPPTSFPTRTRSDQLRPSPPTTRTSTWPPWPPLRRRPLRWSYIAAGKPRRPFLHRRYCSNRGRAAVRFRVTLGGFLHCQRLGGIVT